MAPHPIESAINSENDNAGRAGELTRRRPANTPRDTITETPPALQANVREERQTARATGSKYLSRRTSQQPDATDF
jgi:hypothetical protein